MKKGELKIFILGLVFLILVQAVGLFSFYSNSARLRELEPWKPVYYSSDVPDFARWDSGWYVSIVKNGYVYNKDYNSNVTFFPFYPLLIKGFSLVFPINYFYLGLAISLLAFFGALFFLYKLLRLDYPERQSFRNLFYFFCYPWAFFFIAVYSESLFLFLVVLSFYLARRQKWFGASVFGGLAAATRVTGVFLFPALLLEYFSREDLNTGQGIFERLKSAARNFSLKIRHKNFLWLGLIPLSLVAFMVHLKLKTGYFLAFIYNQATYQRRLTMPWTTLWRDAHHLWAVFKTGQTIETLVTFLTFLALAAAVWLLIKKAGRLRLSYQVFAWLSLVFPLFSGTTVSLGRYIAVIFPVFIAAALIKNRLFKVLWLGVGGLFALIFAFLFVGWYFVG